MCSGREYLYSLFFCYGLLGHHGCELRLLPFVLHYFPVLLLPALLHPHCLQVPSLLCR